MNEIKGSAFLQGCGSAGEEIIKVAEELMPRRRPFSERARSPGGSRVIRRIEEDKVVVFAGKIEMSQVAVYRNEAFGEAVRGDVPLQQIEESRMSFDAVYSFRCSSEGKQEGNNAVTGAELKR